MVAGSDFAAGSGRGHRQGAEARSKPSWSPVAASRFRRARLCRLTYEESLGPPDGTGSVSPFAPLPIATSPIVWSRSRDVAVPG